MSYKKGKDIKVPFDCLWHYYTRKFEVVSERGYLYQTQKPEDFDKW